MCLCNCLLSEARPSLCNMQCMLLTAPNVLLMGGHQPLMMSFDLETRQEIRQVDNHYRLAMMYHKLQFVTAVLYHLIDFFYGVFLALCKYVRCHINMMIIIGRTAAGINIAQQAILAFSRISVNLPKSPLPCHISHWEVDIC